MITYGVHVCVHVCVFVCQRVFPLAQRVFVRACVCQHVCMFMCACTFVRVDTDTRESDSKAKLPWRVGDMMITYGVSGGAVLTLRASGTEPKLKW